MNAQALQENEIFLEQLNCFLEVVSTGTKVFMRASALSPVFFPEIKDSTKQKEVFMQTLQEKILPELSVCSVEKMFCYTSFVFEDIIIDDYEISDKGIEKVFAWFKEHSALDIVSLLTVEIACIKLFQTEKQKIHFQQWQDLSAENDRLTKELHNALFCQTEQLKKNSQLTKANTKFLQSMLTVKRESKMNTNINVINEFYKALEEYQKDFDIIYPELTE